MIINKFDWIFGSLIFCFPSNQGMTYSWIDTIYGNNPLTAFLIVVFTIFFLPAFVCSIKISYAANSPCSDFGVFDSINIAFGSVDDNGISDNEQYYVFASNDTFYSSYEIREKLQEISMDFYYVDTLCDEETA